MKTTDTFREAKRLYALGFAIHWLHPNSKRPLESGWTTGPRKSWQELADTYTKGYNVGVRLGAASAIAGRGFLAVVDVDVKSGDERHRKEAIDAAKAVLRGAKCPIVLSGRGNGSRHYYCVVPKTFKTWNPAQSSERVKVYMPSKAPSKKELAELSPSEIAKGIRFSHAWEISLYSEGRQVVVPPSIHPDSNKPYRWRVPIAKADELPSIEFEGQPTESTKDVEKKKGVNPSVTAGAVDDTGFELTPVILDWLEISDRIKRGIMAGEGVTDRSAFLLPACTALVSAGLTKNEILTVLTEPDFYLGKCAYDHAKTTSRKRAALWIWKYTLKKVMQERDAVAAFTAAAKIEPIRKLSETETRAQNEEMEGELNWYSSLEKTEAGKYRATLNNCKTILSNVCGQKDVVGRNEFAANDYYLADTPWRSRKGEPVSDIDIVRIKFYCAETFGIEFGDNIVNQALLEIADLYRFHPVRDWLKSLKWDGVHRIDTWLKDYAGAIGPDLYLSEVSRKMLVAMVARIFKPGIKFDHMVILEGNQGVGKSTLLRRLTGDAWFSDATLNIGDKDAVLTMQSKWLIEMGELSSLGRAELEQVKVFVTQTTDRIRAPYGKRVEEFPRQSIFVGTTNLEEYLRDLTGNRRFWPVKLGTGILDFNGVGEIREQLFAEAVAYWNLGEPLYLDSADGNLEATIEQNKRSASDEWISIVADILDGPGFPLAQFEMRDVAKRMDQVGAHRLTQSDVQRLMRCFKLLGCTNWRESSGLRRRLWKRENQAVQGRASRPRSSEDPLDEKTSMIEDFY